MYKNKNKNKMFGFSNGLVFGFDSCFVLGNVFIGNSFIGNSSFERFFSVKAVDKAVDKFEDLDSVKVKVKSKAEAKSLVKKDSFNLEVYDTEKAKSLVEKDSLNIEVYDPEKDDDWDEWDLEDDDEKGKLEIEKYLKDQLDLNKEVGVIQSKVLQNDGFYDIKLESFKNLDKLQNLKNFEGESEFLKIQDCINEVYDCLKSINSKGFINETDLLKYNIIGEVVAFIYKRADDKDLSLIDNLTFEEYEDSDFNHHESYLKKERINERIRDFWLNIDEMSKNEVVLSDKDKKRILKNDEFFLGRDVIKVKDGLDLYTWSFNLIILKLYYYCECMIFKLNEKDSEFYTDLLLDYKNLSRDLLLKLNPMIRSKIGKKGASITQNIYTGFDTEYVNINTIKNKLLSVQLSVSSRTSLSLPMTPVFDYSEVDVLNGKNYNTLVNKGKHLRWKFIENMINGYIKKVRSLKYGTFDGSLTLIIEKLKRLKDEGLLNYVIKDNVITFLFERNKIQQNFQRIESYTIKEMANTSYKMVKVDLSKDLDNLKALLLKITSESNLIENELIVDNNYDNNNNDDVVIDGGDNEDSIKNGKSEELKIALNKLGDLTKEVINLKESDFDEINQRDLLDNNKKYTRTANTSYTGERLSITTKINNYLIAHYTPADLSIMDDFDEYKYEMDIVNKSFVTLRKPILIDGVNIIIRDSKLITPGRKSLDFVASLYEGIDKIDVSKDYKENMELLWDEDPDLFKRYALKDSLITLIHGSYMEEFNNSLGGFGIPLTLSGLSRRFISLYWEKVGYKGYQYSNKYPLINVSKTLTPKGLSVVKDVGVKSTMYIASYKGGRNESFMYGYENSKKWFDLDLVSCYTSIMLMVGSPDYEKGSVLSSEGFKKLSSDQMIFSFTVLIVDFEFPKNTKYPCIACVIEEGTQIYPLNGQDVIITSLDYIAAIRLKAKIVIKQVYYTPFKGFRKIYDDLKRVQKKKFDITYEKPFNDCIKEIQGTRGLYQKGTINNILWKEIGNSIYGLVVQGINEKKKFDARTGDMKRIEGSNLANPLIASWITSFARSVIGELLYCVDKLDGVAVSVTTDGFITDVEDLELKINSKSLLKYGSLYYEYRKVRGFTDILEVKKSGVGVISWCTRGQLSVEAGILAATGFQRGGLPLDKVKELFLEKIKGDKELSFIEEGLRSGKDIYLKGGHVTRTYTDKIYRFLTDHKRFLIQEGDATLIDSRPVKSVEEAEFLRYISKLPKTVLYSRNTGSNVSGKYKSMIDLIIRNFVKALLKNELNLDNSVFESYKDIIHYLKEFYPKVKMTENSISQLKRRSSFNKIARNVESEAFVEFVKLKFPDFNDKEFFK